MDRAFQGETSHFETTHVSVSGEMRNIDFRIRPVFDDKGKVIYLVPEGEDITERKKAKEFRHRQDEFDAIINRILLRFASNAAAEIDASINMSLEEIGRFVDSDSAYVIIMSPEKKTWSVTHFWVPPGFPNYSTDYQNVAMGQTPWNEAKILEGKIVNITNIDDLPPEAEAERSMYERQGVRSGLLVPLHGRGGGVKGCVGFRSYNQEMNLIPEDISRIQVISEVIANVLERKRTEENLRTSEAQLSNALRMARAGHWEYNIAADMFKFNDNFYRIFQTSVEEAGGYTMSSADYVQRFCHPDDKHMVYDEVQAAIETDDPYYSRQLEHRILFADRRVGYIAVWFFIVKDTKGRTIKVYGVNQDITESRIAEEQIKKSLREKEILLQELYHRTKNNMQVISAMLRLKSRRMKNNRLDDAFKDIENKILSMALVHQKLYESKDLSYIDLRDYINSLIVLIERSYSQAKKNISIKTKLEDANVLVDTAIPIGLVINELLSNSFKHAFPDIRRGEIQINLHVTPKDILVLEISDNGIGFPKDFELKKDKNLGLQTIFDLVEDQLNGEIRFIGRKGVHCRLTFTKELYQPRV